ncbi:MAG: alpha/beta fold hydrolase [Thermoproteota archaeon]|nr:alpha/beta fold hydrolase [Candidatus Brockarchaeota archaeon]MBO3840772.1 alpha/beta fold hydrolase [Candidatus Brockarchaeota archaeon]
MKMDSGYLTASDGVKLFYQYWLPEKVERILVCIHGASSHSGEFAYLGNYLSSKDVLTFTLDLRSNGRSGGERGDIEDIRIQLNDIDEMVNQLKDEWRKPIYMLGHSLGASYALWYGSEYYEKLAGLVLVAPAIRLKTGLLGIPAPLSDLWKFPLYSVFMPSKKWDVSRGWPQRFRESEDGKCILNDENCVKEFTFRYLINLSKVGGRACLKLASKVNIPTLILQGVDDELVEPRGAEELYEKLIAQVKELRIFEGADHCFHGLFSLRPSMGEFEQEKQQICQTIYDWLTRF